MKGIIKRSTATKKKIAAVVLAALMLVQIFSAAAEKNPAVVTVSYDGIETIYETYASTVEEFLTQANIVLKDNDYINYTEQVEITDDMYISIDIAKTITIKDDGVENTFVTYKTTVGDVMEDFGTPVSDADGCYPKKRSAAFDGMTIRINRAKAVTFTRGGSTLEYDTISETVGDFLNEINVSVESNQEVTPDFDALLEDGMEIMVEDKVPAMSPLNFDVDLSKAQVLICEATAYTTAPDECGPNAKGITASGVKAVVGCVAVDPRVIPLKTRLYIETMDGSFVYGYCVAEDTGGAIKGNKVDLLMNTKSECFQFGRRKVKVYILPEE